MGAWVVRPRPATAEENLKRFYSLSLAGRIGKLGWASALGQVTDEEVQERKRLLDLLDGFGWRVAEEACDDPGHDLAVEARLEARHFGDDDPADV